MNLRVADHAATVAQLRPTGFPTRVAQNRRFRGVAGNERRKTGGNEGQATRASYVARSASTWSTWFSAQSLTARIVACKERPSPVSS